MVHEKDRHEEPKEKKEIFCKKKGDYPKDFVFDGWHPQCFCFVTPILVDEKEMAKMNEAFIRGEDYTPKGEQVTEYPEEFKDWVRNNASKIKAAQQRGTEPYFIRNNADAVEGIINPKAKTQPAAKENSVDNAATTASRIKDEVSAISSVKDLRDYFTANIADDFNIDVNKKDLEAWKEIALQLRQRMEEFSIPKFSEIGIPSRKNAVASYDEFDNSFNLVLSKVKSSWKAEQSWRRKGIVYSAIEEEADVIRATIDHELGHKLYKMYGMKESTIKAFKIAGKSVLGPDGKLFAEIDDVLGYYASTNESEYFAEAFAKYMSRNRASLGPETAKLMDEFMAKVNARGSKGASLKNDSPNSNSHLLSETTFNNEFNKIRKKLIRQNHEQMIIMSPKGSIVCSLMGDTRSVNFDDDIASLAKNNIVVHNHPSGKVENGIRRYGYSLSRDDIFEAINCNMRGIIAESPIYRYYVMRPEKGWGVTAEIIKQRYIELYNEIKSTYHESIKYHQAENIIQHLVMKRLSSEFEFEYGYKPI